MTLNSFHLLLHLFALFQCFLFSPDFPLPLRVQSVPGYSTKHCQDCSAGLLRLAWAPSHRQCLRSLGCERPAWVLVLIPPWICGGMFSRTSSRWGVSEIETDFLGEVAGEPCPNPAATLTPLSCLLSHHWAE